MSESLCMDTIMSIKILQVTLGVLQGPQRTVVSYYSVNKLTEQSVMSCVATLTAVMRWACSLPQQ